MAVLFKFGGVGGGREDDMEVEKLEEVLCFDKLEACPTFLEFDRQDARPTNSSGMFRFSYSPPELANSGPAAEGAEHCEHRHNPRRRGGRPYRRGVAEVELVDHIRYRVGFPQILAVECKAGNRGSG